MENLPYINMPDYFTHLLQVNMQTSGEAFRNLSETIYKNKSLYALFNLGLRDIDKDLRVEKILNAVGWYGLRDRLSTLFIYYQRFGQYPSEYKNNYVTQIIQYERKIQPMTIDGYSRAFLLGMYVEMANYSIELGQIDKMSISILNKLCISFDKIDQLLRLAQLLKGKTVKVDFLILYLAHLNYFFGSESTLKFLKEGKEYQDIYLMMSSHQRKIMIGNFLAYGNSISDADFFIGK